MDMQTWRDSRRRAEDATEAIQAALAILGLPEATVASLRPVVTHSGKSYVDLGMIRADHAERMAEAIRTAIIRAHFPPALTPCVCLAPQADRALGLLRRSQADQV
ncbi:MULTISPECIES: hypothetical protein [Streptomyces]|uniref:Uncharacterized protein n=1 Tax=Streptomyces siderophoricus TaxID=2802281 RepID=A0ABS1MK33_9ACTN|nr:hypothetical protein [Streptomyces sp. 9-7]MBL1088432.1 hypothetical protein [Streptomyces sp. 9-7]